MKYAPKTLKLEAANYGFAISRQYEAVDNKEDVRRNADGSWTIKARARVRVHLQMVNQANRYHIALVDNLPAGLEIINPDLAVSQSIKGTKEEPATRYLGSWFNHQNLRDNRAEAFQELLYAGVWHYTYVCRATNLGQFIALPAKAEEMYTPETFGRSKTDLVKIE
jgi:alpha-2-macroglobulin